MTLKRTRSIPQNVNYAVKTAPLLKLISKAGLGTRVTYSSESAQDPVQLVEKATVLILVSN